MLELKELRKPKNPLHLLVHEGVPLLKLVVEDLRSDGGSGFQSFLEVWEWDGKAYRFEGSGMLTEDRARGDFNGVDRRMTLEVNGLPYYDFFKE